MDLSIGKRHRSPKTIWQYVLYFSFCTLMAFVSFVHGALRQGIIAAAASVVFVVAAILLTRRRHVG